MGLSTARNKVNGYIQHIVWFSPQNRRRPSSIQRGGQDSIVPDIFYPKYPWQLPMSNSHITLVGVDPVKQCLGCHPLHRQSALQAAWGSWGGPGQSNEGVGREGGGYVRDWMWEGMHTFSSSHHSFSGKATCPGLQQRSAHGRKPGTAESWGRGHAPTGLVSTYIGCLFIVVDVVNVPSEAKVRDLHHIVLRHQDIPGSQVSVYALWRQEGKAREEEMGERRVGCG